MQKLFLFLVLVVFLGSCDNCSSPDGGYSPSQIRHKYATKYRNETTGAKSKKEENRHRPHRRRNSVVGLITRKENDIAGRKIPDTTAVSLAQNLSPWINAYVRANGLQFPQYFIMRVTELQNFLSSNPNIGYLHFYLALNNKTNSLDLVMAGADSIPGNIYSYTDFATTQDSVFSNFMTAAAGYGVSGDQYLEGTYVYPPYPTVPLISTIQPSMPINQASMNIYSYEQSYDQFATAYSFLIDVSDLLTFINNAGNQYQYEMSNSTHGAMAGANVVVYIQIYLAYENSNPDATTIILVGLDANGHHVYYNNNGSLYVFNTAVPCPFCNVDAGIFSPSLPVQQ